MKQLTVLTKILLFLTSYSPLAVIYLIIDFDGDAVCYFSNPVFSLLAVVILVLIFLFTYFFFKHFNNSSDNENVVIINVSNMDGELLSYIFTYILPFLSITVNGCLLYDPLNISSYEAGFSSNLSMVILLFPQRYYFLCKKTTLINLSLINRPQN